MAPEAAVQPKKVRLLEAVFYSAGPLFTFDDARAVASDLGMSAQDLRWTLHSLSHSGWIERIERGV